MVTEYICAGRKENDVPAKSNEKIKKKRNFKLLLAIRKEIMYNLTNLGKNPDFVFRSSFKEREITVSCALSDSGTAAGGSDTFLLLQRRVLSASAILMTMDKERTDSHL